MKKSLFTLTLLLLFGVAVAQEPPQKDVRYDQYGKLIKERKPLSAEARNGILVFESKEQDYKLWFDIRIQADAQLFSKNALNEIGDGAKIRRARFAVKANLNKHLYGELDINVANGVLELNDAYLQYDFLNGLSTRVGNFKEPFSMTQTTSSRYIKFMERSLEVGTFAPSRHIGWETSYSGKKFLAVGGIFFQEIEDAEKAIYTEDNNKDFGRDEGISLTGKFIYQPFNHKKDYGVHLGFAYSYRTPKTSYAPGEWGMARYSSRSLSNINRKKYLDTDLIPHMDHESFTNFELAMFYKGLSLQSEIMNNNLIRKNNLETLNFGGFHIEGGYMLLGGRQVYNKGEGEFTQPDLGRKWGDVELVFRYDYVNLNDKDIYGGSAEGVTAGLNIYSGYNFKFQINYSYVNHDRYASGKNKLYVGKDVEGNLTKDPTKVATAAGNAGDDYGMLGVRFQIAF
ncbi:MAG: hypothetical protein A2X17_01560 [Bacteroidetes bacterium GWF2_41_61]|nr:MAG: hypothetical protein A2X20_06595 [Bacteroidetes bacterium GWE2_40_15]OFY31130.1 MAG: hypothetical protein A2X17_01560 [Bacteroidetes bacterium GWF2_41_61]OFY88434.1 MAG: hypothetical protein A2266_03300 [Bacteroidetes bacterium RIFOXYA12_FULL_40_10]HBG24301.1 porin [Rikenellaceae bacterium]HBZ26669.1 porin [Rikenellaceae bacterium]